MILLSCSN